MASDINGNGPFLAWINNAYLGLNERNTVHLVNSLAVPYHFTSSLRRVTISYTYFFCFASFFFVLIVVLEKHYSLEN